MNFGPEERDFYEDHLKWLRIEANTLKKTLEDGIEIGEARGEARGKEEVAKNLLKAGIALDLISNATGLSIEKIEKLK